MDVRRYDIYLFIEGLSEKFLLAGGDLAGVFPHAFQEQETVPLRVKSEPHADLHTPTRRR